MLEIGDWRLEVGDWRLEIGTSLSNLQLPISNFQPPTSNLQLLTSRWLSRHHRAGPSASLDKSIAYSVLRADWRGKRIPQK
jgi:hypothetical protein